MYLVIIHFGLLISSQYWSGGFSILVCQNICNQSYFDRREIGVGGQGERYIDVVFPEGGKHMMYLYNYQYVNQNDEMNE